MQSRVQRLSHMLFHQLFPQQLDRRQLKNSSDPRLRLKFWYFFHNMEGPGFTGGARCRNAYSLSAARRVNREIVRSVSQQQVHKCGRILSGEKNHLSREKYLASHRVTPMCAILKQFWLQHIFLLFPIPHIWLFLMHCNAASVTEPAKANPPYTHMRLLQELHALHTEACRKAIHGRGLLSRHHVRICSTTQVSRCTKLSRVIMAFFFFVRLQAIWKP